MALCSAIATPSSGAEKTREGRISREPCADHDPMRRAFFGDLHVHTVFSLDASTMGTVNRPADAYRFARGEQIGIQPYAADGSPLRKVQLARPLDFAAVTDHAELFGEWNTCNTPDLPGHDSLVCRMYRRLPRLAFFYMNYVANQGERHDFCGEGGQVCLDAALAPWAEIQRASEEAYDRSEACTFTAFTGYEWTGGAGVGNNFHRNVIFANDVVPRLPISFIDAPVLTDFWGRLGRECTERGEGCDVVVIPHNSNLSAGRMFRTEREDGSPIEVDEARARARFEVLVELMQHKGESECMTGLGNEDELCGFEKLAQGSFRGRFIPYLAEPPIPRQFVRNILREGLAEESRLGVNPFAFGFVGSTDTHLGTPGLVDESGDFPGHGGAGKPPGDDIPVGLPDYIDFNPGGLAGLWAEENSRTSLFAAMRRKEAFATSGPRIVVRFFGGFSYPADLCDQTDLAEVGYARGVPMGSVLRPPPAQDVTAGAPVFAVSALADPGDSRATGTPLQRVQIVKGWLSTDGTHERVYDVAGNPENGAGVSLDTCETHGPDVRQLCSVWRDPDFDPQAPAFYYARVIENPSCRWTGWVCMRAAVDCTGGDVARDMRACCDAQVPRTIQERAWTSPIWYTPAD
jgi:hypothetical protein